LWRHQQNHFNVRELFMQRIADAAAALTPRVGINAPAMAAASWSVSPLLSLSTFRPAFSHIFHSYELFTSLSFG
jgi:hypothetical protein